MIDIFRDMCTPRKLANFADTRVGGLNGGPIDCSFLIFCGQLCVTETRLQWFRHEYDDETDGCADHPASWKDNLDLWTILALAAGVLLVTYTRCL